MYRRPTVWNLITFVGLVAACLVAVPFLIAFERMRNIVWWRGAAVTNGTKSKPEPPGQQRTEELRCKRCGGEMLLATVLSSQRLNLFRCHACNFYDLVKV
jgi:DNA-directed RNA polymerase subunit RPC12/RpoP